ncbi:unnamed protein product [Ilex paraguariensis]|uniref:RRM domain-containing protein n=1 Tax=Ilex paraguariensis TaxID=185542 RepID=A0ABC8S7Z8_9AQUA
MSASSLSMAATVASIAFSSSSSASLPLSCKLSHLSSPNHFTFQPKPTKPPKLKTQFPNRPPFSLLSHSLIFRASAAFDSHEFIQNTEPLETDQEEEEDEEGEAVESQSAEAGRLYVGNLPYAMTSSQLAEVFGEAGRVVSVEIVYDRVTDRSRGFAFVTMGSVEEAKEAIVMFDGSQVGGRTVKVNFPEVPRGGEREVMGPMIRGSYQRFVDSPHKIYAGNLSWDVTSQSLREAFADQPGLQSAKVIYDRDSGRSRGFGFVTFASAEEVEAALNAMNEVEMEGRPLRLNLAEQRASPTQPARERNFGSDSENSEMLSSISST